MNKMIIGKYFGNGGDEYISFPETDLNKINMAGRCFAKRGGFGGIKGIEKSISETFVINIICFVF